jgi:DNA-binding transcriptional ArsR family regulator
MCSIRFLEAVHYWAPGIKGRLVRVADRLRVLRQVARLRLVEQLRAGETMPQELADTLGLTQQNVSKHLQDLTPGIRLKHADV